MHDIWQRVAAALEAQGGADTPVLQLIRITTFSDRRPATSCYGSFTLKPVLLLL